MNHERRGHTATLGYAVRGSFRSHILARPVSQLSRVAGVVPIGFCGLLGVLVAYGLGMLFCLVCLRVLLGLLLLLLLPCGRKGLTVSVTDLRSYGMAGSSLSETWISNVLSSSVACFRASSFLSFVPIATVELVSLGAIGDFVLWHSNSSKGTDLSGNSTFHSYGRLKGNILTFCPAYLE